MRRFAKLRNTTINGKLLTIFVLIATVAVIQGGASLLGLSRMQQQFESLYGESPAAIGLGNKMNTLLGHRRVAGSEHVLATSETEWRGAEAVVRSATDAFENARSERHCIGQFIYGNSRYLPTR